MDSNLSLISQFSMKIEKLKHPYWKKEKKRKRMLRYTYYNMVDVGFSAKLLEHVTLEPPPILLCSIQLLYLRPPPIRLYLFQFPKHPMFYCIGGIAFKKFLPTFPGTRGTIFSTNLSLRAVVNNDFCCPIIGHLSFADWHACWRQQSGS